MWYVLCIVIGPSVDRYHDQLNDFCFGGLHYVRGHRNDVKGRRRATQTRHMAGKDDSKGGKTLREKRRVNCEMSCSYQMSTNSSARKVLPEPPTLGSKGRRQTQVYSKLVERPTSGRSPQAGQPKLVSATTHVDTEGLVDTAVPGYSSIQLGGPPRTLARFPEVVVLAAAENGDSAVRQRDERGPPDPPSTPFASAGAVGQSPGEQTPGRRRSGAVEGTPGWGAVGRIGYGIIVVAG